jgi:hypothetical protein
MTYVLKTGALAEKHRTYYRAKRNSSFIAETSITLEAAQRRLIDLGNGQRKTIMAMTDTEFRAWYRAIIEQWAATIMPSEKKLLSIASTARKQSSDLRLDETTRWYLVDKLYGVKAFRDSGIAIFACEEATA